MLQRVRHRLFGLPRFLYALLAVVALLGFGALHSETRLTLYGFGSSFIVSSKPRFGPPWTRLEELEAGTWVPRQHPVDLATEWRGAYATLESVWDPLEGESSVTDADALEDAKAARARAVASWEWLGTGAVQAPVDWQELAVRLLRSTGGLILVGGEYYFCTSFDHLL